MNRLVLFLVLFCLVADAKETFTRKVYAHAHGMGHKKDFDGFAYADFDKIKPLQSLPKAFDWRDKGAVTPVKDQGRTGDCWAFATTGAFESAILRKSKKKVLLSEQYLNDCNPYGYNGTWGGDFPILNFQVDPGQPLEKDYPFANKNQRCKKNVPLFGHLAEWSYIGGMASANPSVPQIKTALVEYGPVVVDVAVDSDFQSYGGGVLNSCNGSGINHMVLIVGWNDADGGYWIVKNSWGEHWGEEGYIRMLYGCDRIAETAAYVQY